MTFPSFDDKDPSDVLTYTWDWSDWLDTGITIAAVTFTIQTGLTLDSQSNTTTTATATISGGTVGETYVLNCQITTSDGQIKQQSVNLTLSEN